MLYYFDVGLLIQDLEFYNIDLSFSFNFLLIPSEAECLFYWKYGSNYSLQVLHTSHCNFEETAAA